MFRTCICRNRKNDTQHDFHRVQSRPVFVVSPFHLRFSLWLRHTLWLLSLSNDDKQWSSTVLVNGMFLPLSTITGDDLATISYLSRQLKPALGQSAASSCCCKSVSPTHNSNNTSRTPKWPPNKPSSAARGACVSSASAAAISSLRGRQCWLLRRFCRLIRQLVGHSQLPARIKGKSRSSRLPLPLLGSGHSLMGTARLTPRRRDR